MKRSLPLFVLLTVLALLLSGPAVAGQGMPPLVDILGRPDSRTDPPNVYTYVSVVDPVTGSIIEGLESDNFSVQVSEQGVEETVSLETTGLAVVMLVDRGGIASPEDDRIDQAVDLADDFLNRLEVDGSETADMVALIGIRGPEEGGLEPIVPFTDFDPILIANQFHTLRSEDVPEATRLYDGIDRAIEWFTDNPDAELRDKLRHRRPVILIFSAGVDELFANEAYEALLINECLENNIPMYVIGMTEEATGGGNLETLATQTNGIYLEHTAGTEDEIHSLLENIVSQRHSYRLAFPLLRSQGDYEVSVQVVDTPLGDGSDESTVSSHLQLPDLSLLSPQEGVLFSVPYSPTLEGYASVLVPLSVQVEVVDGIPRDPVQVSYFANGLRIGTSTTPPTYDFAWDVSRVVTPTDETQSHEYTLMAVAQDAYLDGRVESSPLSIRVNWEAREYTFSERATAWIVGNWWLLLILGGMGAGLLVLMALFIRTRNEMTQRVIARTTGVLKGVTRRLGTSPTQVPGKLVVVQGANIGREFRMTSQTLKIGRDPQFCDFALYDEYVSNPHFSIHREHDQFYITDDGSSNGTQVNGETISPHERVLLEPDALIEVGHTLLQFRYVDSGAQPSQEKSDQASPPPSSSRTTQPVSRK